MNKILQLIVLMLLVLCLCAYTLYYSITFFDSKLITAQTHLSPRNGFRNIFHFSLCLINFLKLFIRSFLLPLIGLVSIYFMYKYNRVTKYLLVYLIFKVYFLGTQVLLAPLAIIQEPARDRNWILPGDSFLFDRFQKGFYYLVIILIIANLKSFIFQELRKNKVKEFAFLKGIRQKRLLHYLVDLAFIYKLTHLFVGQMIYFYKSDFYAYVWFSCIPLYFIYYFIFEYFFGTTPGKAITGMEVVSKKPAQKPAEKPAQKSVLQILCRSLLRLIPFDPLSYLGSPSNGLHDKYSNTNIAYIQQIESEEHPQHSSPEILDEDFLFEKNASQF